MSAITLTLVKSTPSENGGFILKLQNKDEKVMETAFGTKTQATQETYYMKVDKPAIKVGKSADLDISDFKVVERPYEIDDEENGGKKTISLKWLQIR